MTFHIKVLNLQDGFHVDLYFWKLEIYFKSQSIDLTLAWWDLYHF